MGTAQTSASVATCDGEILSAGKVVTQNDCLCGFIPSRAEHLLVGESTEPLPIALDDSGGLARQSDRSSLLPGAAVAPGAGET